MAKCKQIKANGIIYTLSPGEISNSNGYVMTPPTSLTADTTIQPLLQSGTSIKTINGQSVLGSGDITVSASESHTPLVTIAQAASVTLDPYKLYNFGVVTMAMTISFNSSAVESGCVPEYAFKFVANNGCAITLPATCKYCGGSAPTLTPGRTYEYNIADGLIVVGEFY